MTTNTTQSWPLSLIAGSIVISLASFFRFWQLKEWLIFSTDQARAMLAGRNILLGEWMWRGPETSIPGFHLGPLYYYLSALGLKLSNFHPVGPALLTAFFGLLTTLVVWRLATKWWGREVGLLSGIIYALSPLAVVQSRIPIEPSPLPLIVVAWLWTQAEWLATRRSQWLLLTLFWPLLAMQLNFSAVILWGMSAVLGFITTSWIQYRTKLLLMVAGGMMTLGLIIGKFLWGTPTTLEYIATTWQSLTLPYNSLGSAILFLLAGSLVVMWILRWLKDESSNEIMMTLLIWLGTSFVAFLLKTVNGDHALGLLFVAPALLIARSCRRLVALAGPSILAITTVILFFLWAGQTVGFTATYHANSLQFTDHLPVIARIYQLSEGQPYNLVYRGHLDVYDAADDHYQYLLWYLAEAPVQAGRIDLTSEHQEEWLLTQQSRPLAPRTITIYYPWYRAENYFDVANQQVRIGDTLLTVQEE